MNETTVYLSLSEFLFEKIASKILDGTYRVGQKLVENDIQVEYEVSKSPVREAFQMLINIGLVERKARRGCFVSQVTPKDIIDNYIVRAGIEKIAATIAYEKSAGNNIRELRTLYESMNEAVLNNDVEEYEKYHNLFQAFFSQLTGNKTLIDICERIRMQNMWYRTQYRKVDITSDLHTHDDLLTHFELHDVTPEEYGKMMETHIQIGLKNFKDFYAATNSKEG